MRPAARTSPRRVHAAGREAHPRACRTSHMRPYGQRRTRRAAAGREGRRAPGPSNRRFRRDRARAATPPRGSPSPAGARRQLWDPDATQVLVRAVVKGRAPRRVLAVALRHAYHHPLPGARQYDPVRVLAVPLIILLLDPRPFRPAEPPVQPAVLSVPEVGGAATRSPGPAPRRPGLGALAYP